MTHRRPITIAEQLQSLILTALFSGLVAMAGMTMVGDFMTHRASLTQNLAALARLIGVNGAPAIARGDPNLAANVLLTLSAENDLMGAALYAQDGKMLAQYALTGDAAAIGAGLLDAASPSTASGGEERTTFYLRHVDLVAPIIANGSRIGTIALRSSLADFYQKIFLRLSITLLELSIALGMALVFTSRLRRRITRPIGDLSNAMGEVKRANRFDIQVEKLENDEIGVLIDGFNAMLTHIRERDAWLERYRQQVMRQNEELKELATRDPLTGCLNRRAFFEALAPLLDPSGAYPLACVMIDIDKFKSINDNHGHQVGDQVIQAVAKTLTRDLRPQDLLCRYGGEEFCLMLPRCSLTDAVKIAERLRAVIESEVAASLRTTGPGKVSASLGVAVMDDETINADILIERADQMLYQAKRRGRNRVCRYPADWVAPEEHANGTHDHA